MSLKLRQRIASSLYDWLSHNSTLTLGILFILWCSWVVLCWWGGTCLWLVVIMGYPWWGQIFVTLKMVVVMHMRGSNSSHSGRVFLFFKLGYDVDLLDF